MKRSIPLLLTAILAIAGSARAESPAEKAERMRWFNEARFGMFIHWGVYAEAAGMWNGEEVPGIGEWIQSRAKIPAAEYRERLEGKFNPVKYDPDAWVRAARDAGMRYLVITSKHHDGFCLWPSELTDWTVASTPYGKDLLGPLEEACRKHGIRFAVYHSIMDWAHPDYGTKEPWRGNYSNPNPDMDAYTDFMKGQLTELMENYRPAILWFDGEWEDAWTHERGKELYHWLREKDPALIINNRVDKGRAGMAGLTKDDKYMGDYGTPEQQIPATGLGPGVAWESCMTMNDTWGFKKNDHNWKSTATLVRNLIDIASKGGNYLLNVGPTAAGEIPAPSLERLAGIGEWMRPHGESIHGTVASLFPELSWDGRSTTRLNPDGSTRLYVHVFEKPADGVLKLAGLVDKPVSATLLGRGNALETGGREGEWTVKLPEDGLDPVAAVVALDFPAVPAVRAAE